MTTTAQAPAGEAPTFPAPSLDRRFYAFAIDRLIAWPLIGLGVFVAYQFYFSEDRVGAGIAVVAGAVVLVGGVFAVVLGLLGVTPGKAMLGLRVVHIGSGTPIGVGPASLRTLILGVAGLPTFGLGVAMLAWTAVMDAGHQRRGWHDIVTGSIVVDVRPVEVVVEEVDQGPRHIVNLTAMRLMPTHQPPPVPTPPRSHRAEPAPAPEPAFEPAPIPEPGVAPEPVVTQPAWPSEVPVVDEPTRTRETLAEAGWRVTFDDGASFVVEGVALLGRRPEARLGETVQHLVPLQSGDMSVSKTHAQLHVAPGGELVVLDRGSTNGSILIRQGTTRQLTSGRPATLVDGDMVRFGDRTMTVTREG